MNWLPHFWFGYLVPSLWGNGPEALAQTAVYGAIAVIFVPRVRKWMEHHVDSIKAHITAEHKAAREHSDKLHAALHERLDRIEGKGE